MKTNYIQTSKTARYYTLGKFDESTDEILFVLHGYGELASEFISKFTSLENGKRFIIAPEAMNRFYLRGLYGKVGATWMTKEDRENEIKDYINYLDNVYNLLLQNKTSGVKVRLLGFSQGGATASRWFTETECKIDELILWGSSVPHDINYSKLKSKLTSKLIYIIGDKDKFITKEKLTEELELLDQNKIDYEIKKYSGKHDILPELKSLATLFR